MPYQDEFDEYEELGRYIEAASRTISREFIPEKYPVERKECARRIKNLIREVRMLDRDISVSVQEKWKNLPTIQA